MAYRFVHAADIHLDSPMRSLALRDPELAELIGNATRRAFVAIVDLCLAEKADALLLAGDLYDDSQTSMKTARFLSEQLRRLHEAGIRVFIIRGNHDAMSKITKELTFPDSVTLFGSRAEVVAIEGASIAIHGLSFAKPLMPESLLPQYRAPAEDTVNIGLMHTSLDGAPGHQPYAPCSMTDLRASGFRYWALGHIHKRSAAEGDCTIVMPGIPQGRDINEAGAKSVTLVTIADDRSMRIEEHLTSIAQFERVAVDASGIADWPELVESIAAAMQNARELAVSPHLVARLRLFGATPLVWRIRRDLDLLEEEAKARASLAGQCWVEKVEIECTVPGAAVGSPDNPVSELRRLIDEDVVGSDAYQAEVERIAAEMRSQLPQECRGILGMDEASGRAAIAGLVREGADDVLARLHGGAETEEAA